MGETNDLSIQQVGVDLVIRDNGATINAGPAFTAVSPNEVTIPASSVSFIRVSAGDLSDTVDLSGVGINSFIDGGAGSDNLTGGSGDDELFDGSGIADSNDTLFGGPGNDFIRTTFGSDAIDGGTGKDNVSHRGDPLSAVITDSQIAATYSFGAELSSLANIESLEMRLLGGDNNIDASTTTGTAFAFSVIDQGGSGALIGGAGDDLFTNFAFSASGDSLTVEGGGGSDFYDLRFDSGDLVLTDTSATFSGNVHALNAVEGLSIRAGASDNILDASAVSAGTYSTLTLDAGAGNDTLISGSGDETLNGRDGDDTYVFADNWGNDIVNAEASGNDVADFSAVSADLTIFSVVHTQFVDDGTNFVAVAAEEVISGSGNDTLQGSFQSSLWNIVGADRVDLYNTRYSNVENLEGQSADDTFVFANGAGLSGLIDGGTGSDTLDYSSYGGSAQLVVAGPGSLDGSAGTAANLGVGFDNIDVFLGLNSSPTIVSPTEFTTDENETTVGSVVADDPDGDTITYSIVGGDDASQFSIDGHSGELTFVTPPDYETPADANGDNIYELEVLADDGAGGTDLQAISVTVANLASIHGSVFVDVDQDGEFDADELGIDGVVVELFDQQGNAVFDDFGQAVTAVTGNGGYFLFEDLDPGEYQLREIQPTGVSDGSEVLGSLGGSVVANDVMQLTLQRVDAFDYAFTELGQAVVSGDAASIGFWQNKHGQQLIATGGTNLANWLSTNFNNVFGDSLASATGEEVADYYRDQLFKTKAKRSAGPAKVDAQFMAVALATYFTNSSLAGSVAVEYGFNVTDTGLGAKLVNLASSGTAFSTSDNTELTVMQLLQATDALTDTPDNESGFSYIYDSNGDGVVDSSEASLRAMANSVFSNINEA